MVRGNELVIRPAVEELLAEAKQIAASKSKFATYEDVFGSEEKQLS